MKAVNDSTSHSVGVMIHRWGISLAYVGLVLPLLAVVLVPTMTAMLHGLPTNDNDDLWRLAYGHARFIGVTMLAFGWVLSLLCVIRFRNARLLGAVGMVTHLIAIDILM